MKTRGVTRERIAPEKSVAAWMLRRHPTPAEALLWERLRANRLGGLHLRRQQVISGFIADFYCAAAGLAIEVDGSIHSEMQESDVYRDAVLAERDIATLRVTNAEVMTNITGTLHRIYATATARIANESVRHAGTPDPAAEAPIKQDAPSPSGEGVRG